MAWVGGSFDPFRRPFICHEWTPERPSDALIHFPPSRQTSPKSCRWCPVAGGSSSQLPDCTHAERREWEGNERLCSPDLASSNRCNYSCSSGFDDVLSMYSIVQPWPCFRIRIPFPFLHSVSKEKGERGSTSCTPCDVVYAGTIVSGNHGSKTVSLAIHQTHPNVDRASDRGYQSCPARAHRADVMCVWG
eukprot:COSAG01_NODE_2904_length_6887_cov_2.857543_13_plen_189_part_01